MGKMSKNKIGTLACVKDFEKHAALKLTKNAYDYYNCGSMSEHSRSLNENVFSRYRIRPRHLVDVSKRDLSTRVLGQSIPMPIGVSPTALQKMAHSDGECGNARAVGSYGSIFILSSLATTSIENVAASAPDTIKWLQIFAFKNKEITASLVRRAENAGFQALVLTIDTPVFGVRYSDTRNEFVLPPELKFENFEGTDLVGANDKADKNAEVSDYAHALFEDALFLSWESVSWLKSITRLPIVVKGVLTREDARTAVRMGVSGILVSNHGGRQLDACPASLEALPEIVDEVGTEVEVYFDGGIRYGSDVFKAIAFGARMVFIGRPALWGLACDGENGVKKVLGLLRHEYDTAMALSGCRNIDDIQRANNLVVDQNFYAKM